jgi:hypothetical protein
MDGQSECELPAHWFIWTDQMLPINPNVVLFNWKNARALAEMSAKAYLLGPWDSADPTPIVVQSRKTDAHAIVQLRNECIVVAFRGSCEPQDFIQDAKFEMVPLVIAGRIAMVHKGFREDFVSLEDDLIEAVQSVQRPSGQIQLPIFITGHSLGGALAVLFGLTFKWLKFNVAGAYTFGQPRVGDREFCNIYDGDLIDLKFVTYRVVNQNDIVPRVPPLLCRYRHCGHLIFMPPGGGWKMDPSLQALALADFIGFVGAAESLHDVLISEHAIENYRRRMMTL